MYKVYRLRYFRGGTQLSCMMYRFFPLENELLLKAPVRILSCLLKLFLSTKIKELDM